MWSMISTMVASLPASGPSLTRTTRPTSTKRLKVVSADMAERAGGRERGEEREGRERRESARLL